MIWELGKQFKSSPYYRMKRIIAPIPPVLVICPSSLILNWEHEIHKFSPDLKCLLISGSAVHRSNAIAFAKQADVCITSYDYLKRDIELYQDIEFTYQILDEAQVIKNIATKNALSVKQIKSKHRFALTGTPIENSLSELWRHL